MLVVDRYVPTCLTCLRTYVRMYVCMHVCMYAYEVRVGEGREREGERGAKYIDGEMGK